MITLPRLVRYSTTLVAKEGEQDGQKQEERARTRFNFKTTMKQAQLCAQAHKKPKSVKSSSTFRL
jgi:hypothetical protein